MRAWLLGLGTSALYLSQSTENEDCNELWALADEVIGFLSDPQIDLVMAYTSSRAQLMIIVVTMLDVSNPKRQQELRIRFDVVLEKILRAAKRCVPSFRTESPADNSDNFLQRASRR